MATVTLPFGRQKNFPSGINEYCPKLTGLAGVGNNGEYLMDMGQPALASVSGILLTAAVGATYVATDLLATGDLVGGKFVSTPWGREVDFVASGAGTNVVTVYGRDYLNQPIKKVSALNGATRVALGVAFMYIDSIVIASGGSITVNVGYTARLGYQYRTIGVNHELVDETKGTVGTLVAPDNTDPATNATVDPRGLYTTNAIMDGSKRIVLSTVLLGTLNSSGNGGYHGIQHYGG